MLFVYKSKWEAHMSGKKNRCSPVRALMTAIGLAFVILVATPVIATANTVPVYRFYNFIQGAHFYTTSETEKAVLESAAGNWTYRYEGMAYKAETTQAPDTIAVHRFYNFLQGVHFYTADQAEATYINDNLWGTFRYEGIAYYAYPINASPSVLADKEPIHRFYNFIQGNHFYTANQAEATNVNDNLWGTFKYEGIAYYAPTLIRLTIEDPILTLTKTFDGDTTAAVTAGALIGIWPGDTVTVSAVATYDTANVGTGKTITVVYTLAGADAAKYVKPDNYVVSTGVINAVSVTGIGAITGTAQVDQMLMPGALTPAGATVTYQWQSSDAVDGVYTNIVGATTNMYTTVPADLAMFIRVVVTGTGNYTGSATSAPTGAIAAAPINIAPIPGLTVPDTGGTPVATITPTAQYTGTVVWLPADNPFLPDVIYTATVTLTPAAGYTLTGVAADFFTVVGATTVTNPINTGVITATFPATSDEL
jgi:hypothetical protein